MNAEHQEAQILENQIAEMCRPFQVDPKDPVLCQRTYTLNASDELMIDVVVYPNKEQGIQFINTNFQP